MVAVDSAKPDDKVLDCLRIDTSGKGKFADAASIPIKWPAAEGGGSTYVPVGPVSLKVVRNGKEVPVIARGYLVAPAGEVMTGFLVLGVCCEGECQFGPSVRAVRIVDSSGNFTMNTPAGPDPRVPGRTTPGERVLIDAASAKQPLPDILAGISPRQSKPDADGRTFVEAGQYGNPVLVDGVWYDLKVSDDGAKVKAAPTPGPIGKVRLDADRWHATLASADHILAVDAGKEAVDVPAGKYAVQMAWVRKDKAAVMLVDFRSLRGEANLIEVAAGKIASDPFGLPLTARIEVHNEVLHPMPTSGLLSTSLPDVGGEAPAREVVFQPTLADAGGRWIRDIVMSRGDKPAAAAGADAEPPKAGHFEVTDAAGKVVYTAALEFS